MSIVSALGQMILTRLNKSWKNIQNAEKIFNVSENDYPALKEMEDELKNKLNS